MSENDGFPRVARQRYPGPPDRAERDAFAKEALERLAWFTSREGRRSMDDKQYRPISVASGIIEEVMHLAGDSGMSPLQVLSNALLGYSAVQGFESPEVEELRTFLDGLLDKADARERAKAETAPANA